ncbi:triose-phosphate isomerase [Saccharospirillum mangrovi]|uniref:triose-phosphate isomerase n=1 Tax=Saccharospirillum mangrovi TaxID=2161747 RepID=UPI000D39DBBE|nr:triose-phosphate isomerase [Saccharospirillum mangrovi]
MRRKLVAANWKMNGSKAQTESLLNAFVAGIDAKAVDAVVFPPALYVAQVAQLLNGTGLEWGTQNVHAADNGAFTGELSLGMVKEFGCRYVLIGHSERRELFGETNADAATKVAAALNADVIPMLCVGETLQQREAGTTEAVVGEQLDAVLNEVGIEAFKRIVIAYEPVWAIGTGKTATPEQAQAVHAFIRARLAKADGDVAAQCRVLYGGSVKAANAQELFQQPDIDGGLVGGASLQADEFTAICQAAAEV